MTFKRSKPLVFAFCAVLALFIAGCGVTGSNSGAGTSSQGQDKYPTKPITFIEWNDPGSSGDTEVRTITQLAGNELGVPIKVVSMTGGNGADALEAVLSAPADGYTISHFATSLAGFMNMPNFPVKATDFDYLSEVQESSYMLAVNNKLPINTIQQFVQYAKDHPGGITVAGSRVGSVQHQNLFSLTKEAGIKVTYVPEQGGSSTLKDVLGGHVDGLVYDPASLLQYVKAGTIRPLLIFANDKNSSYPDVPTVSEAGFKFEPIGQVHGVMAKKGIPEDRKQILENAFVKATQEAAWKSYLRKTNTISPQNISSAQFTSDFMKQVADTKQYLTDIGILK